MSRVSLERARRGYADFTGHAPTKVSRARLPDEDRAAWKMGKLEGVAYEATRDGKTEKYFHEFKRHARPDLVAQDDGKQLYITGGRYKVTDRGVEDMPALFVVNPSKRPSQRGGTKKGKSPMRRRRRTRARRATRQVAVFRANPIRRRRRRHAAASHHTARRSVRRYRRNPIVRTMRRRRRGAALAGGALNLGKMLVPAIGIGAGAVGSELIMGYLPLPAQLKQGAMRHITKGAVGIGAGMILAKGLKQRRLGNAFALGAVVIAAHDWIKEILVARMPALKFGAYVPTMPGLGYTSPGQVMALGEYVNTAPGGFAGADMTSSGTPEFSV